MDIAAELSRGLQAALGGGSDGQQLRQKIMGTYQTVIKAEDELLQALAVSVMPLDDMTARATRSLLLNQQLNQDAHLRFEDHLVQELLQWFKHHFFTWVNAPACHICTSPTTSIGVGPPTTAEAAHDASRTEVYQCTACSSEVRFPRYNDVQKLLETRCGRCGEWANCFLLCCRAAGLTARYVLDWTDHVWTEYWSEAMQRWVHLDSCEAAWDTPLVYEAGWGKKLSYVVAISTSGVVDVTRRYTRKMSELLQRRTDMPEPVFQSTIQQLNRELRQQCSAEVAAAANRRDALEQQELEECSRQGLSAADLSLPGRQSGAASWRADRGEDGASAPASAPTPKQECTAYRWAEPGPLGPLHNAVGRLAGGVCRASGEHGSEAPQCLFDGRLSTKWLDFKGAGETGATWVEYRLLGTDQPTVTVLQYDLVSANDFPDRDPSTWVLEGWTGPADGEGEGTHPPLPSTTPATTAASGWVPLDWRTGVQFPLRHQLLTFTTRRQLPCRAFRLRITRTKNPAAADCMQLAGLHLYGPCPALGGVVTAGGSAESGAAAAEGDDWQGAREEALQALAAAVVGRSEAAAGVGGAGGQGESGSGAASAAGGQRMGPADTGGAGGGAVKAGDEAAGKMLKLLRAMVGNLVRHPGEAKFRRVRLDKVRALVGWHEGVWPLLFAAGFRVVVGEFVTGSGQAEELLVAPDQEEVEVSAALVAALVGALDSGQ